MTTNVQIPYVIFIGDGSLTRYEYEFSIVGPEDLFVMVDDVLQVLYSAYTVENINDFGGDIVFVDPPAADSRVLIFRSTTASQNVDYESFSKFPADTHEWNLDKIVYILQELINGAWRGIDSDGNPFVLTFDLSVTAGQYTVTVNNSGGTDAVLPAWVSATFAGMYIGEIGTAPADESATTRPDGYVWIETDGT